MLESWLSRMQDHGPLSASFQHYPDFHTMTSFPERMLCVPQAQKGAQAQTEECMLVLGEGQLSHSDQKGSGDLGPGLGVRPQETPPWCPAALRSAGGRSPGHEGKEGDLHEDVPPEDKRAQRPQRCCGLRGRAQGTSTMAWTPLLLSLLTLCTGAAPWPCSQAQDTQDPGLGLPGTQSAVQAPPQGGMPGEGVLPSHPVSPLSSRLRGLL